jgi:hypothetical protein
MIDIFIKQIFLLAQNYQKNDKKPTFFIKKTLFSLKKTAKKTGVF